MRESVDEFITMATHITPMYNDMPGSPTRATDKMSRIVVTISDAQEEIRKSEVLLKVMRNDLADEITELPNKTEAAVLVYRYILFMPWKKIADRMNLKVEKVYPIHRSAVENFYEYVLTEKVGLV